MDISHFKAGAGQGGAGLTDLIRPPCADRPRGFTTRGAASTARASNAWAATSTSWTAKVSKVDVQLGRDVIGWLPEVMKIVQLGKDSKRRLSPAHVPTV